MKKRHIAVGFLVVLLAGIGVLVYVMLTSLDQLIEAGIEKYGPRIAGAEVRLDGVNVDLRNGQAELNGLFVGNPDGFETEHALKLDTVRVKLDMNTITQNPVVIREVLIESPDVIYEMAKGGSNIDRLSDNINAYTGGGKEAQQEESGRKLIIDDLYVNNGKVTVSHTAFKGRKMTSPLPDIHLSDIGRQSGGASPGEVAKAVMDRIKTGSTAVASRTMDALRSGAATAMEKGREAGGALKEKMSGAGEKLKGLFDKED